MYCYFFLSFFLQKKTIFVLLLLALITFYDFTFINIASFVTPAVLYLVKSWQEYLLLFLCLYLIATARKRPLEFNRFDKWFMLSTLSLTVIGFIAGLVNNIPVMQIFLGWRMYLMPLLWSFILYKTGIFRQVTSRVLIHFFVFVSIVIVLFAIYQNLTFNDNLRNLWFYEYIDKLNPIEDHPFDFIRDEQLRVTGIFVSPLIYSSFLSYCMLILIYYVLFRKTVWLKKITAMGILALLVYGQLLSRTRIGFIILIVGLCCSFLVYLRPFSKYALSILIPLMFLAATMISLVFGITEDLSALGRLVQYATLPSNFSILGMGFGAEMTNVFFDSFYISVIVLFGAFVPLYLNLYYFLLKAVNRQAVHMKYVEGNPSNKILFYSSYGFFFSFIYTFGFHFSIGSATIQIFYLMLFYFISKFESVETKTSFRLRLKTVT